MSHLTDDKSSDTGSNTNVALQQQNYRKDDPKLWRDLVAYWFLGLCNNYGYVVMLSAAHDIIEKFNSQESRTEDDVATDSGRYCHIVSTGTILLADIIPALIMKGMAPFIPFWINVRIISAIAMASAGFIFVGLAQSEFLALLGVVLTSAGSGLGETTFLAYSSNFNKNVVSTWSSGTGGAGISGSLSYAALKSLDVDHKIAMLIMLIVPLIECIAFWLVLRKPALSTVLPILTNSTDNSEQSKNNTESSKTNKTTIYQHQKSKEDDKPLLKLSEKLYYILRLLKYMIPLTTIYAAEYFINQGLFELVYFENIFLDKASQYRWLNVDYQIGVFVARSTVNIYSVDRIWLMAVFQFVNVIYFLCEVILYMTPSIWITFLIVFWEGLLGGGAYVNTFYKMSKEVSPVRKQFAISVVALADSIGISIAGLTAIPVHNAICNLAAPIRNYWL